MIPCANTGEGRRLGVTYGAISITIDMDETIPSMGFLGCGKIASSIIAGFLHVPNDKLHRDTVITVTSRTKEVSTRLTELFPKTVHVVETAQEVVQRSDIIFLCVLPEQVPTVLNQIELDPQRHTLISLAVSYGTCFYTTVIEFLTSVITSE
jgi:pyrroline-5-carboxylate reductase